MTAASPGRADRRLGRVAMERILIRVLLSRLHRVAGHMAVRKEQIETWGALGVPACHGIGFAKCICNSRVLSEHYKPGRIDDPTFVNRYVAARQQTDRSIVIGVIRASKR